MRRYDGRTRNVAAWLVSILDLSESERIDQTNHRMTIVAVVLVADVITVAALILLCSFF